MATVFPSPIDYHTDFKALTGGTKTDCFTVPTGFKWKVTSLRICASTGTAGTATIATYDFSATTEFVQTYNDEVPAVGALEFEGMPHILDSGDILRVTGANLMNITITYVQDVPGRGLG